MLKTRLKMTKSHCRACWGVKGGHHTEDHCIAQDETNEVCPSCGIAHYSFNGPEHCEAS